MQLIRDFCYECNKLRPIVNKKHYLCDECNFKRTHNGKSKKEVYSDRASKRAIANNFSKANTKSDNDSVKPNKKTKISSVSSTQRYRCSDGQLVSQREININLKLVKELISQVRVPMCQGSGRWDVPLSNSHTISVARCKELGKTELIWDEENIELEGWEAPTSNPTMAHNIWENGTIKQKVQLLNFERKLQYIAKHDPEQFIKLKLQIDELRAEPDTEGI